MSKFKTIFALSLGLFVLIILSICARLIHGSWTSVQFAYSLLVGVCGVVMGWLIGFLASPYSREEAKKFSLMTSAIIGFFAGYAGTKIIDPVADYLFSKGMVFTDPPTGANVLIFVSALVVSTITGYAYRTSFLPRDTKTKTEIKKQNDSS